MRRSRVWKAGGIAVATLLAIGIAAPFVGADHYRGAIQSAMQNALGRPVKLNGPVHLSLFSGPGFTVDDVVIGEDPRFGAEPFAYITTLACVPQWWSLWTGHLAFSSLHMSEARLNLATTGNEGARWNFEGLLRRELTSTFPGIRVTAGRLNFRLGTRKAIFYVTHVQFEISPPSAGGDLWRFTMRGEPARTDRAARAFGLFHLSGSFHHRDQDIAGIDASARLERSEIGDILALLRGYDAGVHGVVSGTVALRGSLANLTMQGRVRVEDVHRWDQNPPQDEGIPLDLNGQMNLPAQLLDLAAQVPGANPPLLSARAHISAYLHDPSWAIALQCNKLDVSRLLPLARHMGVPVAEGISLRGKLDAAIGYSRESMLTGRASLQAAELTVDRKILLSAAEVPVRFDGGLVHLERTVVSTVGAAPAPLETEGVYDLRSAAGVLHVTGEAIPIDSIRGLGTGSLPPALAELEGGTLSGNLDWRITPQTLPLWTGRIALNRTLLRTPALSEPLHILHADLRLAGESVSATGMHVTAGLLKATARYQYVPGEVRPHRFQIDSEEIDAAALERLLEPTLRRDRSLLSMAIHLGRPPLPDWMRGWHAEGTLTAGIVSMGQAQLADVRTRFIWDTERIQIPMLEAHIHRGALHATGTVNLHEAFPAYEFVARAVAVPWKSGAVDVEGTVATSGSGNRLLANLQAAGTFAGHSLVISSEERFRVATGSFRLNWTGAQPQLALADLQVHAGDEIYTGTGALHPDGQLQINLVNNTVQRSVETELVGKPAPVTP